MSRRTMKQERRRVAAWDSADGGALSRIRRHQKHRERMDGAREAEAWLLNNKNPSTPSTVASTPSPPHSRSDPLPSAYLDTISSAFGPNVDLYELLKIDRHASDRDIRIAYFRRGREVLTDNSTSASAAAMSVGCVSEEAKIRFQAVSMAYEILSNPAWRKEYEQQTRDYYAVPYAVDYRSQYIENTPTSVPRSRSIPNPPTTVSFAKRSGVRWNEEVEELVFNQDPREFDSSEAGVCGDQPREKKSKKRKKKKRVVVGDDEALEDHLAKLDEVADHDPFNDFWDDLEASIDGLMSFGSKVSRGSTSSSSSNQDEVAVASETKKGTPRVATPPPQHQALEEARSPVPTVEKSSVSRSTFEAEDIPDDERRTSLEPAAGKENVEETSGLPQDIVIDPQDVDVQPPSNIAFKSRQPVHTDDDDSVSTMSVTTVGRSSQRSTVQSAPRLSSVSEEALRDLAEHEGEWALHKTREPLLDKDEGGATTVTKASGASSVSTTELDCINCCSSDSQASESRTQGDATQDNKKGGEVAIKDETSAVSDFFYHLYSYMQAFAKEVSHVAEKPASIFDGVALEGDDLESFFGILRTELGQEPQKKQ